ncbi:PQQ-binding-like beta-propeller repeat protein [Streptomyces sp. SID685]|uniref:serine/threonine-protein kinase n=1 Tax=Streptomyces TaxID=1883 RepID=UPI00136BF06F|nr:serine/threonine-protein kinase [Streptomyces sp. SID685]MYR87226.1 PQQ-binding-like beta-propeller repeat protein [Streptomyces sp. SID685]
MMKHLGTGDPVRLGPYRLLGVLGEGGMGKVYVGQDRAGTAAAVKVLRPELAHDTGLAQRFVREALAASAVRSPGVAAVLGAQTEGGRPWIATEFLAGPTLDQIVDRHGPLDDMRLRALAVSIAHTLRDIHAAGFIHRDLKPPNIVVTADGPRIIDFGIARPEHGLTLTTTGQIPVTPGYGAPEQVLGQRVAPAADIFSLGAVLVYAATGQRAFGGAHVAAVQYEVVHGEPHWDGLTPEQHALIAPCLAKDAATRPTPEQIADAFALPKKARAVWRHGPIADAIKERERAIRDLTAPLLTTQAVGAAPSRRRLLTGFAAGGALLAATGGTGWWLLSDKSPDRKDLFTIPPAVKTPTARILSADDGDYIVGGQAKPLWSHEKALSTDSPAPLPIRDVLIAGPDSGGIAAFNVVDGKRRWQAPDVQMASGYLSLSDRLVAAVGKDGTLHTFVPSTGEPKWTAPAEARTLLAADAEAVYVLTKDYRLRAVGRSDGGTRWTALAPTQFRSGIRSPGVVDGNVLVVASTSGHALAVDTRTGSTLWALYNQSRKSPLLPAARSGVVYLNGMSLAARRLSDGKELWQEKDDESSSYEWGPATVHGDSVYAAMHGIAKRFGARDGDMKWQDPVGGSQPLLIQGSGAWTIDDHNPIAALRTLDIEDGSTVWTYNLPYWSAGTTLAVGGNRAFAASGTALFAFPVF